MYLDRENFFIFAEPACGERDIAVTTLARCMCVVRECVVLLCVIRIC